MESLMNSNEKISKQVKYIQYWMSDLQPNLTSRYLSSLRSLLSCKLSLSELSLVAKAAILLINKTTHNKEEQHPVLELAECLLSGFISCYTEYYSKPDQNTVLQEVNSQVTELLLHCCQEPSLRNSLVVKLSESLISVVTNSNLEHWLRISWLKSINSMLIGSSHSQKSNILKEHVKDLEVIVDFLFHCGDYDTQTCLVEFLLRIVPKVQRASMIRNWLVDLLEAQTLFIKIRDFETDCRQFLNCLNTSLNIHQLVFSVPVMNYFLGDQELFKPPDRNYSQFWVDFNLGTRSVSTYCVRNVEEEDCGWELVTLKDVDIVSVFIMSRSMNSMILTLNLSESYNPDTDSGVAEIVMESRYMEQIQSLLGRMFGDRCQIKKDQMIHDNNSGVVSETVSNLRNIPREQDEDSYSQHSSLPCAQQSKESPEVIQYKLPQSKKKNDYSRNCRDKSQIAKTPKSPKAPRTPKAAKTPKSSRFNKSKSGSGGRIGDKVGQCYTPVVALDRIPRSEEVTAQKIDLCKDNTEVEISEKISVDSDLLEMTETQKCKVLNIPEGAMEGREGIVFTETKMDSKVITEETDRESVKPVEPITPKMVEESHLHRDSDTTLTGGRKRATRKISEQEQKRIKSRIIPSQLNFDSSHNSSELKKKVSSLRQSIMKRSLKKRISQSPSLLKIPEMSGQGNKLFKKLFKERKKQSCVTSQELEVKQDRALTGNIAGGGAKSLNSSLVIAKSNSNDVGLDRDSAEEFKTETRDLPKNGSVRKTYTRNKLSRRKAPRMEAVSVDNLSQSKITGEYMLKTQKLCDDQSCENQKKSSEPQINNSKKIAIKRKPEVNVLSKKARCVTEDDAENVSVQCTENEAIYEDYATKDGDVTAGASLEEHPSDCGIPLADGREHAADTGLLATESGVPAIDSSRISMVDGENCTSIDYEVLPNADAEASGVNPKASVSNRGVTTADHGTFMSDGETSAVTQWLRLTLPVLKMISCDVKKLQPKDRNLLKRKWSSIMDY